MKLGTFMGQLNSAVQLNEAESLSAVFDRFIPMGLSYVDVSSGDARCKGEPMVLAELLKEKGVSTALDTCGFASRDAIDAVLPYTDTFLFDIKAMDEAVHIRATGQSNQIILDNLHYIDTQGKRIEVRIPYIPGYNDTQIPAIADFLQTLTSRVGVKLLPYHNYAEDKYAAIGTGERFAAISRPSDAEIAQAKDILKKALPNIKTE